MTITYKPFQLELTHTFGISRESHNTQDTLIVCLSKSGKTGYGEATSNPYYNITAKTMIQDIDTHKSILENNVAESPEVFYNLLETLQISSFTKCALDMAFNDLFGKLNNTSLLNLWGINPAKYPTTNYTIGIDSLDKMIAKLKEKPWPIYKIKLGTDNDIAIITELRKHTNAIFRVDANCAWTAAQTIANAPKLKALGVEFIEQPLPAENWADMEKVYKESVLPIIADESCLVFDDVEKCASRFHGINIKLTKCGGLTPARQMIKKAKELGLKVMIGCMTESTVGISAIAQLLPLLDYVDMDGAMLLKSDIANGVTITPNATVVFPKEYGTGVSLIK